jgi:hypothetical protein
MPNIHIKCRSQWLRRLKYELSSLSQTQESWIRIPLEAYISVFVCSVYVVLRVVSGLPTG